MIESIFIKIMRGDIPCNKIYEDETTFAFLTIQPHMPGHTLVVPKRQVDHLWDLTPVEYQAVMATAQKVALRIRDVLQPKRVAEQVAGMEVPHAHVHLYPFSTIEEFWTRPSDTPAPADELAAMAARLRMPDEL